MSRLDKNEYKVRLEEIKQLIEQENYVEAASVADQIEWKKVRNVNTLCMISEVYEAVDRYEDSNVLLLRAYRRSPMSRTVLYRLVEVTIALRQFDESIGYYTEYVQAAPNDLNRYILKYKIYRGRGSSVNEQIDILKEYLDQEYNEKYAYELAKLYREADRMQECIAACDDLVLWFHSGTYVIKALELKRRYAALTPKQQEIYDGRFAVEDEERELEEIGQEKQMVGTDETTLADSIIEDTEKEIAEAVAQAAREQESEVKSSVQEDGNVQAAAIETETQPDEGPAEEEKVSAIEEKEPEMPAEEAYGEDAEASAAAEASEKAETAAESEPAKALKPEEAAQEMQEAQPEEAAQEMQKAQPEETAQETQEAQPEEAAQEMQEAQPEETAQETQKAQPEETAQEMQEAQPEETAQEMQEAQPEEAAQEMQEAQPAEQVRQKTKEELQTDIARDMREIIGNVGRLEYVDETEQAMDDLIEESKKDQAIERESRLRIPKLRMPDLQRKQAAGKLTIDDILLSMGERGDAVREAAAKAVPYNQDSPGVLSAVDEALLNMGITPENSSKKEEASEERAAGDGEHKDYVASAMTEIVIDAQPEEAGDMDGSAGLDEPGTGEEAVRQQDDASGQPEEVIRKESDEISGGQADETGDTQKVSLQQTKEFRSGEDDVREASVKHGSLTDDDLREALMEKPAEAAESFRDKTMEEIIAARTRRIPTEQIASMYGRRALDKDLLSAISRDAAGVDSAVGSMPEFLKENIKQQTAANEEIPVNTETKEGDAAPETGDQENPVSESREPGDESRPERSESSPQTGEMQKDSSQDAAGPEENIRQQTAAPRGPMLKEELRDLFEGFLNVRGMENQIVSAIRQTLTKGADRTSRTGNILIFGGHGAGKTTLAMALAKAIAQEKGQEYVKMARIYSTDLNRKDIAATVAKIAGGVLIVEEAGDLDDSIADQLTTAMEFRTDGLVVIFEDEQSYVHDLLMRHPRLTMKFTSEIYIPSYTAQELAGFGEAYADSRDFALSDTSREVLTAKVQSMMEDLENGQQLSITAVNEVMDRAMTKASGFGRKLFGGKKRYDEVGRVILRDKDFS